MNNTTLQIGQDYIVEGVPMVLQQSKVYATTSQTDATASVVS